MGDDMTGTKQAQVLITRSVEEQILRLQNEIYFYERSLEYVRTLYPVLGEYDISRGHSD